MLIVESDPTVATAIETAGARLNLLADRASDGWDAIGKLEENDYSVVFVDLEIPQASGFGVLTYLRQELGHELDRVVLMTRDDESKLRNRIHEDRCRVIGRSSSVDDITETLRGMGASQF
jgi:DNA-binding response OmpR family regulator